MRAIEITSIPWYIKEYTNDDVHEDVSLPDRIVYKYIAIATIGETKVSLYCTHEYAMHALPKIVSCPIPLEDGEEDMLRRLSREALDDQQAALITSDWRADIVSGWR